jgi:XTP/dITP diphosphohydrolase
MKLVLATNNRHKIAEMSAVLSGLDVDIVTKDSFPDFPDVEETGSTLEENAKLKAIAVFRHTGLPSLADDTGLEVDALNGEPGVYSSRFAGPGCSYADNNHLLLTRLSGVPSELRTARFRCVIAVCFAENAVEIADGSIEGRITTELRGTSGFGYDPVFEIPELGRTFAEITAEQKNSMSHRGRALVAARKIIENYLRASGSEPTK